MVTATMAENNRFTTWIYRRDPPANGTIVETVAR
jgi:hypothetical protein